MALLIPSPERKLRLTQIQKALAAHKEDGGIGPLAFAVKLMLEEPAFQRHVINSLHLQPPYKTQADLMKLIWAFVYQLLYAKDFVAVAMVLWDEETFSAEPHCTQLVWNALIHKRMICVIGGGGLGKCLGPDVPVLMFDGSIKPAKDVAVGDKLMGDDGKERNVLQVNPGHGPMYRIVPERGEPWTCNGDHILSLRCGYTKKCGNGKPSAKRQKGDVVDVPLDEYLKWSPSKKEYYHSFHVGVDFPEVQVPFDPYIYGAWLGDGGFDVPAIHKPDGPMAQAWVRYFESLPGFHVTSGYHDACPMWCARVNQPEGEKRKPNPFTDFIRTSRSENQKIIRADYLRNSRKNRLSLLAGLIDSDGSISGGSAYEIVNKNETFAKQVVWLARSLGFAATAKARVKKIAKINFSGTYWHIRISCAGITDIPTLAKKATEPISPKDLTHTRFSVERIEDGPYNGFVIDGNRRFLLGDFTVTHNTYSTCAYFLLQWLTDPEWTRVQVASASADHLQKNSWGDIVRLYEGSSLKLPGKLDTESISLNKKRAQGIFTLILPGGPESKGKLKGSHTKPRPVHPKFGRRSRVFCLVDEAQEVPQNIFAEIPNRFSTVVGDDVDHIKFVLTANPKNIFSEFGQCGKPVGGWDSIGRSAETWESALGWTVVSLDASQHENVLQRRVVFPGFVTYDGVQNWLKRCHGNPEDPQMYTYVYGKFPPAGLSGTIIPQNQLTRAEGEWIFDDSTIGKGGADPAFTGDRPTLACGRVGRAIAWIDAKGERHTLDAPAWKIQVDSVAVVERGDSQQLADTYMEHLKPLGVQPDGFGIDMTGPGRGTHDIMRHQWTKKVQPVDGVELAPIHGIEYGSSPTEYKIAAEDSGTPKDMFNIMATELWYAAAKLFEFDVIRIGKGVDLKVFAELAARQGGMQAGLGKKLSVESKADFKRRTGMDSPDLADAALVMIHVARITTPGLIPKAKDTDERPPERGLPGWHGFNQRFGASELQGMAAPALPDMVRD